jgi:hypothetical protein
VAVPHCNLTEVLKSESGDQDADVWRHSEQQARRASVQTCDVPRESQRLPHDLYGLLSRKAANRRRIATPTRSCNSRRSPPAVVLEANVDQEHRESRGTLASGRITCTPKAPVLRHDLGCGVLLLDVSEPDKELKTAFVEIMNELEGMCSRPSRYRQREGVPDLGILVLVRRHAWRIAVRLPIVGGDPQPTLSNFSALWPDTQ